MGYEATGQVDLPLADYLNLKFYLMDARPGVSPEAFIQELVHRWLTIEMERNLLRYNGRALHGYQWKSVFLPDGTCLRTNHKKEAVFAKVIGERIRTDDGAALTPSMFANRHTQGRNAWRFVRLRFPGEEHWMRADRCRKRQEQQARQQTTLALDLPQDKSRSNSV